MSDPTRSLRNIFARIKQATGQAVTPAQMKKLGQFAVDIVVKRTRLGYGTPVQFGQKGKLKVLSPNYIEARKRFNGLSPTTAPGKSNLTRTGQLLDSVQVITAKNGSVRFGPTGMRSDSKLTNLQVAAYQQAQGRTFNRVSQLEFNQVLREFRREFGDLLRKRKLIK